MKKILIILITGLFSIQSVYALEYNVYVDPLPSWADYAGNVMYESTKAWEDANPDLKFYEASSPSYADFTIQWVKEFGGEYVGYAIGSQFIEVGLGDSGCGDGKWHPYSSSHVTEIMTHEIGHILGHDHDNDPTSIMYPIAQNKEYGLVKQEFTLTGGYQQFVGLCTIKDVTSYDYHVQSSDPNVGFDVYFVPSVDEFHKSLKGEQFLRYIDKECSGEGYTSYGGTCTGVSGEGGLLIILNGQSRTLTTITVQQQEHSTSIFSDTISSSISEMDSDKDGINDNYDSCVYNAENFNGYQDSDGCPDTKPKLDSDKDGILDDKDKCKTQPETINGYQDSDGCPDTKPFDYKKGTLELQKNTDQKINSLKSGILSAQKSLKDTNYKNSQAKEEVKKAWNAIWWAKKYLGDAENTQKEGKKFISKSDLKSAYYKYKYSFESAKKIEPYLSDITKYLNNAKKLEK